MNQKIASPSREDLIRKLFEAGGHFGYSKSRNHPSTRDFIFTYKNRSAIIDLEKAAESLDRACNFIQTIATDNKLLLLVGNKEEAKALVKRTAEVLDLPYVASRWLGGTLTNFSQIKSRIDRLADLKTKRETGELAKYTKKERLMIDKEIVRLERYLASLNGLDKLPAAVVVIDADHERIVVAEAQKVGIPIISLSGSDNDLRGIDYPIVINDANISSLAIVLEQLAMAYERGRLLVPSLPEAEVGVEETAPTLA